MRDLIVCICNIDKRFRVSELASMIHAVSIYRKLPLWDHSAIIIYRGDHVGEVETDLPMAGPKQMAHGLYLGDDMDHMVRARRAPASPSFRTEHRKLAYSAWLPLGRSSSVMPARART